jgi:hypothetical protein
MPTTAQIELAICCTSDGGPPNAHRIAAWMSAHGAWIWEAGDFQEVVAYLQTRDIAVVTLPSAAMSNGSRDDLRRVEDNLHHEKERERQRQIQANRRNSRQVALTPEEQTILAALREA